MATKIVTKNSSTASAVPTASDLVQGELAVNVADKRLFTEDNAGAIVELGTNPTTLNVNGTATMDGLDVDGTITAYGLNFDISDGVEINALESIVFDIDSDNNQTSRVFQVKANNSTPLFTIAEAGNVGIGTSSPSYPFHVTGSGDTVAAVTAGASSVAAINLGNSTNLADGGIRYDNGADALILRASNTERMRIDSSGDISFYEDTGSTAKLTWSASNESLTLGTNLAITTNEIDVASGDLTLDVAGDIILDADGGDIRFLDGGTEFGRVFLSSNNFYIQSRQDDKDMYFQGIDGGSAITALRLDMSEAGYATFNSGLNSGGVIELPQKADFPATGVVHYTNSYLYAFGGTQGSIFKDRTGVNEFLKLQPSQIVFNEDGGDMDFRVESDAKTHALFVDASSNYVMIGNTASTTGEDFLRLDANAGASGHVIITGRDDTSTKNHIVFVNPNGAVGSIQTAGSATAFNTSSDQRLKENIADADDSGELIDAMQVRKFDWKADGEHQRYGMVAQELQTVAPEAVSAPENPDEMMGVDYSKLVPMLIKEIQSLRNRVAQLEE